MFTPDQLAQLQSPLDPSRIKQKKQDWGSDKTLSYLSGEDVIRTANRIFGFGNWSSEAIDLTQTSQQYIGVSYADNKKVNRAIGDPGQLDAGERLAYTVGWMARVKVTVASYPEGLFEGTCSYTDVGHGDGTNMPSLPSANEFACKEAVTDGVKRCLRFLGDQFGLTLWDKDQEHVGAGPADKATRDAYFVGMKKFGLDEEHAKMEVEQQGMPWGGATADDLRAAFSRIKDAVPVQATAKPPKVPDVAGVIPKDDPADMDPSPGTYEASVNEEMNEPVFATKAQLQDLAAVVKVKGVKNFQALVQAEAEEHGGVRLSWVNEQLADLSQMPNKATA